MADLMSALEPLAAQEPRSTLALAAALRPTSRRDVKVLTAGPGGRTICPVVRSPRGVWTALPVLSSVRDAAELGRALDRSPVLAVDGPPDDVEAILAHMQRHPERQTARAIVVPWQPVEWPEPDDSTRMANAFDVPAIVALFAEHEGMSPGLQRHVEEAVRRMWVVVSVGDTGIDGAMALDGFTPQFMAWGQLTVAIAARGHGRSWAIAARAISVNKASGLGFVAVLDDSNPMTMPDDLGWIEERLTASLSLPNRVPGERRARRLLWRAKKRASRPRAGMLHDA